jgi:hypothetical protein
MNLYTDTDIISEMKKEKGLKCLGNVKRIPEEIIVRKVFKNTSEGKRFAGNPGNRWLYDRENYLKKMAFRGWRKTGNERDTLKFILQKARVQHGA